MKLSRQRLEDNPANYDGLYSAPPSSSSSTDSPPVFQPWVIYPPPPSPHWTERGPYEESTETTGEIAKREAKRRQFKWDKVVIPGQAEGDKKQRGFAMDSNGVYQVYSIGEWRGFPFCTKPNLTRIRCLLR